MVFKEENFVTVSTLGRCGGLGMKRFSTVSIFGGVWWS